MRKRNGSHGYEVLESRNLLAAAISADRVLEFHGTSGNDFVNIFRVQENGAFTNEVIVRYALDIPGADPTNGSSFGQPVQESFNRLDFDSILIVGDEGNDRLISNTFRESVIEGGTGDDVISGSFVDDVIDGGDGDDRIVSRAGFDNIIGGMGVDTITAGAGNDIVNGGDGNDTIFGNQGDDSLSGGNGNDRLFGQLGRDVVFGESGNDLIQGLSLIHI